MRVTDQITFEARDDAEALRLAAERLGKDAVILSTRPVKTGGVLGMFKRQALLVSAGILEDTQKEAKAKAREKAASERSEEEARRETIVGFQKLLEFKERSAAQQMPGSAASPLLPQPISSQPKVEAGYAALPDAGAKQISAEGGDSVHISSEAVKSAYGANAAPAKAIQPPAAASAQPAQSGDAKQIREEVGMLSQRIDMLMEQLSNSPAQPAEGKSQGFHAGFPIAGAGAAFSGIEERLRSSEVDENLIKKLVADYAASKSAGGFEDWLAGKIRCADANDPLGGRKVMLLGPTGVGKTTTIAKLAAIQALREHRDVLLLTSDTYRIAAVEQLRTYAKILDVPMEVVYSAEKIQEIISGHDDADLILLDTAGRAQRDKNSVEVFETLYSAFRPDAVHLVLAANMKYRDMLDVVSHAPKIPISNIIFTKLDETVSYGAIFNIQQHLGCAVSYLTTGQNVPKDIETASGRRMASLIMSPEKELSEI